MQNEFTLAELGQITANERALRQLLNTVGAGLDEYATDPTETVSREVVIDLTAMRAGDRVGHILGRLLSETM